MGTRGATGFILDGEEKITYNHFDSYPEELGVAVLGFIDDADMDKLREKVKAIRLVEEDSNPTEADINICRDAGLVDTNVSQQSITDWYCLLRGAQGDLAAYCETGLMIDSKDFLKDSLFCEWAYLINFDTNMLEVYKGFNKDPNAKGRYASQSDGSKNQGYCGVALLWEISLDEVKNLSNDKFLSMITEKVETEEETEDNEEEETAYEFLKDYCILCQKHGKMLAPTFEGSASLKDPMCVISLDDDSEEYIGNTVMDMKKII